MFPVGKTLLIDQISNKTKSHIKSITRSRSRGSLKGRILEIKYWKIDSRDLRIISRGVCSFTSSLTLSNDTLRSKIDLIIEKVLKINIFFVFRAY